jgi:hypothetical protein
MSHKPKHDDAPKAYEPPVVRDLGPLVEVTRGIAATPNVADNGAASLVVIP